MFIFFKLIITIIVVIPIIIICIIKHLGTGLAALPIHVAGLKSGRERQGRGGREETKGGGKIQDTSSP